MTGCLNTLLWYVWPRTETYFNCVRANAVPTLSGYTQKLSVTNTKRPNPRRSDPYILIHGAYAVKQTPRTPKVMIKSLMPYAKHSQLQQPVAAAPLRKIPTQYTRPPGRPCGIPSVQKLSCPIYKRLLPEGSLFSYECWKTFATASSI